MYFKTALLLIFALFLVACGKSTTSSPSTPSPPLSPQAQLGKQTYVRECGSCHSTVKDTIYVGPSLAGIVTSAGSRVDGQEPRIYLMTSILRPCDYLVEGFDCLMPQNFGKTLTGEEIDAIIAYLLTFE